MSIQRQFDISVLSVEDEDFTREEIRQLLQDTSGSEPRIDG